MTRIERIQQSFTRDMRLIEIGPSYNPIVPKAGGWQTTVVDHVAKAELEEKYHADPNVQQGGIEDVDVVWQDGPIYTAFDKASYGTYDGFIASHVIEHVPDIVTFLKSVSLLLKPSGVFFLAVPDKRLCFDFFQPLSTTGDVLDGLDKTRHTLGTLFDHSAYYAIRGDEHAWTHNGMYGPFRLAQPLEAARPLLTYQPNEYVDCHKWRFTPSSFQLMILELNLLGIIDWAVARIEPMPAVEFFVWLERRKIEMTDAEVAERRLQLLRETVMEMRSQITQLDPSPDVVIPTIAVVIPLYNGERFIEQALRSALDQTQPATEIIVVDDGSTDQGAAVVRQMMEQHPQIRLLSQSNGGQSSARNFGVANTTCDLIALLDQDDAWYPHHLAELTKPFTTARSGAELGWVYSDLDEVDTDGGMVTQRFLSTLRAPHPKTDLFSCLSQDMFILPSASLISRRAFQAVGGFDEQLSGYEDDDLFLRLFRAGYANVFLPVSLSRWRIYPESSSYSYRMRRSRAVYARKLLGLYPDDPSRARYLQRDLILPRFYVQAVAEYRNALIKGDAAVIEETRQEVVFLVNHFTNWRRRAFGRVLGAVRSPQMAKAAFATRGALRPLLRRFI